MFFKYFSVRYYSVSCTDNDISTLFNVIGGNESENRNKEKTKTSRQEGTVAAADDDDPSETSKSSKDSNKEDKKSKRRSMSGSRSRSRSKSKSPRRPRSKSPRKPKLPRSRLNSTFSKDDSAIDTKIADLSSLDKNQTSLIKGILSDIVNGQDNSTKNFISHLLKQLKAYGHLLKGKVRFTKSTDYMYLQIHQGAKTKLTLPKWDNLLKIGSDISNPDEFVRNHLSFKLNINFDKILDEEGVKLNLESKVAQKSYIRTLAIYKDPNEAVSEINYAQIGKGLFNSKYLILHELLHVSHWLEDALKELNIPQTRESLKLWPYYVHKDLYTSTWPDYNEPRGKEIWGDDEEKRTILGEKDSSNSQFCELVFRIENKDYPRYSHFSSRGHNFYESKALYECVFNYYQIQNSNLSKPLKWNFENPASFPQLKL